jgi:hypothetical protein
MAKILADAIEDDDSVVDGKTKDNEKGGDEKSVYFIAVEMSENSEEAGRNDNVVDETNDGNPAVFPRRDRL